MLSFLLPCPSCEKQLISSLFFKDIIQISTKILMDIPTLWMPHWIRNKHGTSIIIFWRIKLRHLNFPWWSLRRMMVVVRWWGGGGWLTTNLFSHAVWQKPKDKLAAGTTNTPFQFGIVPIWDLKEHLKLTLIISTGAFHQGVKGGPQIKCYTRDQWGWAFCT